MRSSSSRRRLLCRGDALARQQTGQDSHTRTLALQIPFRFQRFHLVVAGRNCGSHSIRSVWDEVPVRYGSDARCHASARPSSALPLADVALRLAFSSKPASSSSRHLLVILLLS